MATKKSETSELHIVEIQKGRIDFCILGTTPLILNRMSEKAMRELLAPKGKKTAADKATSLKHDPYAEFVASPYTDPDENGPTLLQHLAAGFKRAICGAALDVPGSNKSQIGRLVRVEGERVPIYGIPNMFMSVTRSADINKTPDIRTRVIVPKWACRISISYAKPILNETAITNLLVAAAFTQGTGDWRTEKGKGDYGSWEVVAQNHPEYSHLMKHCGRKAQVAAMENPEFYDRETEELYHWFKEEMVARGKAELLTPIGGRFAANQNGKPKAAKV